MRTADGASRALPSARAHHLGQGSVPLRVACILVAIAFASFASAPISAAPITKPSTSKTDREAAEREIPYGQLQEDARQKIRRVVDKASLYRRMPVNMVECDPTLYRFLLRYPEVVVNIWQLMGITKVQTVRTAPFLLDATDGMGTITKIELIYGDNETQLLYCEGNYEGPLFHRPLTGRCVLLLKSGFVQNADDRWNVTNRMDVFVQIDNVAIDAVTRTLHPILGKSADLNFVESTNFVERISKTAEINGTGMQRLSDRLDKVPVELRQQFSSITLDVYNAEQQRRQRTQTARANLLESIPAK